MSPLCIFGLTPVKKTPLVVRKAVLPVAGLGTRMLPATKAIPKEMLPVVDKPLIQYVVREAIAAGIKEIILVTHSSKNSIENHFDKSFELEATLEKRVKRQLLEEVQHICPKDVTIMHVRQGKQKAWATQYCVPAPSSGINPSPFCCRTCSSTRWPAIQAGQPGGDGASVEENQISQIMVEAVPESEVDKIRHRRHQGRGLSAGMSLPMQAIVEKPPGMSPRPTWPWSVAMCSPANIWPLLKTRPAPATRSS